VLAAILCIIGIILYWTPIKVDTGEFSIVLGGYPWVAMEKGRDPGPWMMIGYVVTAAFSALALVSLFLAWRMPEEGREEVYEEEEETVTYEEEIYEF